MAMTVPISTDTGEAFRLLQGVKKRLLTRFRHDHIPLVALVRFYINHWTIKVFVHRRAMTLKDASTELNFRADIFV